MKIVLMIGDHKFITMPTESRMSGASEVLRERRHVFIFISGEGVKGHVRENYKDKNKILFYTGVVKKEIAI